MFRLRADPDGHIEQDASGNAELPGDGFMVSLHCLYNYHDAVPNTIMHELGHNLGLRHGGDQSDAENDYNDKPNYNSVMNQKYQFHGVDTDCVEGGDGVLDYSRNTRAALNENALVKGSGICPGVSWDWCATQHPYNLCVDNGDHTVSFDLNSDRMLTELRDSDDWAQLAAMSHLVRSVSEPASSYCAAPPWPKSPNFTRSSEGLITGRFVSRANRAASASRLWHRWFQTGWGP